VSTWKKELQERLPEVFGSKSDAKAEAAQTERARARLERKVVTCLQFMAHAE
jgi:hypothetical protein